MDYYLQNKEIQIKAKNDVDHVKMGLGAIAAKAGCSIIRIAVLRIAYLATAAMATTALVGHLFGQRLT